MNGPVRRSRPILDAATSIVAACLAGSAVAAVGSVAWMNLIVTNLHTSPAVPWSVPAMGLVLILMWWYLSGSGWPRATAGWRRRSLRARLVPAQVFALAWLAGLLALASLVALWIVLVELTGVGGNPTIPSSATYPALTVALGLLMGSLVSPLTEEAAFRGYCQSLLERRFNGIAAVGISSLLFALWHGPTQGFAPSKLFFYFLVGVVFGAIAYLTDSVLPAIPIHMVGDGVFFTLIWPFDAARHVVWAGGPDPWFGLLAGVTVVFAVLAFLAFRSLARLRARNRPGPAVAVS
jgi:membrane protease YdiL (CAAX protease family)